MHETAKPSLSAKIDSLIASLDEQQALLSPEGKADNGNITGESKPKSRKWVWAKRGFFGFLGIFTALFIWLAVTAPLSKSLQPIAPPQIILLASNGQPIARNGAIVEKPVEVAKLPPHVVQAFLSIEDRRFYNHWGVDPRGLARAAINNVSGGGGVQGGSTITQQLAKFTFLTPERSLSRKGREMLIAFWLEAWLTKDEILERYLSNVYFGDNLYGLRAASLHYFYRQPERLTLPQAVMLAGLVQAPSRLAPSKNPKGAAKRARLVLNAMVAAGYLDRAKADATPTAKLDMRIRPTLPTGTYFADWAIPQARALTDEGYSTLRLTTTLDARLQETARRAIARAPLGKAQVALVAMRPNGEVVAMVGGRDYKNSPFNRATQARRQPGSTFKLIVYLTALRAGMTPDDMIDNSPITEGFYRPKNSGDRYSGQITLREAFARSSNVAAVRLYQKLGSEAVIRTARDLGIKSPLATNDPSLALGTANLTLLEMTSAYAAIAADEAPVTPHAFVEEEKGFFGWLFGNRQGLKADRDMMADMLKNVINNGTGRKARLPFAAYGKTGTSQDNRDALFIGYANNLVVGVWIGNDDNSPLRGVNGGGLPARIWQDFMKNAANPEKAAKSPAKKVDPDGPVTPIDLPEIEGLPVNFDNIDIKLDGEDKVTISTEIDGRPVDFILDEDGLNIQDGPP